MRDRPDSETESEVTPEMVRGGEDVLRSSLGGGVSCHRSAPDLAEKVFRVMARISVSGEDTSSTQQRIP